MKAENGNYVDTQPRLNPDRQKLWIGSKANEPTEGEVFNCVFGENISILPGAWDLEIVPLGLVLCVMRPISRGEELTAMYGWSNRIYKSQHYYPLPQLSIAYATQTATKAIRKICL